MVNYQNGMIYKIAHRYSPYVYIGSTCNFSRRKSQHKDCCNNEKSKQYNQKVYQTIRELGGWDNFVMVLVAKFPCNDKMELHAKEFEYQQLFDANLNAQNAYSGIDPCDPEYKKKYGQEYYEKNRVELEEKSKQYYEKNREEKILKQKKYYENNKEKILKKQHQKIECECGFFGTPQNMPRHRKSQRHLNLMSS